MLSTLRKIRALLSAGERRRGALLMVMVVIMALLETAGIASVMPFLAVLGDPSVVQTNPWLAAAYERLGFVSTDAFLVALAIGAFLVVVCGAAFRILTQYALNRFAEMRRHSVGERLLETYLRQPYAFFLNRHGSDMAKSILSEVDTLVLKVFRPLLYVIAYSCVALAIIMLLVVIDPLLALIIGVFIGGIYALIFYAVRGFLGRIGRDRVVANRDRFTAAGEAIGGIKDIKLLGREYTYLGRFRPASIRFSRHQAIQITLGQVPKHVIEGVAVGGVLALAVYLMATGDGIGSVLPVLGLYAFAGYRLLPAAQQVYANTTNLRFGLPAIDEVLQDLRQRSSLAEIRKPAAEPLVPRERIALERIVFTYPGAARPALNGIDLEIRAGETVGIVGGTGAGKTTLVDILLGLLRPDSGCLRVDGSEVSDASVRAWQQTLGYVPQQIFLTDTSIAENIAFGVPPEAVDHERVIDCARRAQLHEFVAGELEQGYETQVGERGVRLSGGQRQRIGIARALYHNPAVLVFDEATSALDNRTEQAVMEAVYALSEQKTIIMIAHRLSTVRKCDVIVHLEHGRIAARGTFEELAAGSESFRMMAAHALTADS